MKVASINIARISTPERLQLLLNYCVSNEFDVICLQEVAFSSCPILESRFQVFASPGPNKAGTAVLVSKTLKVQSHTFDPDGRLLCINLGPVSFVSLYDPSGRIFRDERSTFFRVIVPAFLSCVKEPIVLMGDFNAVDDRGDRLRKAGTTPSTPVDHALVALVGDWSWWMYGRPYGPVTPVTPISTRVDQRGSTAFTAPDPSARSSH
ncbi:hypothetical protein DAPPUDRAFT_335317 [Daphnia pulex]|uniref:exodeoxyribonuclease III n=1 Tax=Daphnia pulex TaxID=6669 RepID=E9HXF3_DAPPU|nr:hypothetical protein DAPPUDRAFT_335317 [Daphnia pulex]|eukprot:EFX63579.1 hypothetical protein DAPPUDRAFT_335317 [Daphnia pulex]